MIAVLVGVIQGVFEWLPISSEGNITLLLTLLTTTDPETAVRLSLYLHAGTAVSATAYYRNELHGLLKGLEKWRPGFGSHSNAETSFLIGATLVSVVVALAAYTFLLQAASETAGGVFVAAIGALLILTGVLQRAAESVDVQKRDAPDAIDTVLVGVLQGVAVLPGVSRSGTTVSALLIRGVHAESSLRLSFLLSIPASLGAGALVVLEGTHGIHLQTGLIALAVSAVVGYLTIDALMRFVERVSFWKVCIALGVLAVAGGGVAWLV